MAGSKEKKERVDSCAGSFFSLIIIMTGNTVCISTKPFPKVFLSRVFRFASNPKQHLSQQCSSPSSLHLAIFSKAFSFVGFWFFMSQQHLSQQTMLNRLHLLPGWVP
jgi:hypothetical protein